MQVLLKVRFLLQLWPFHSISHKLYNEINSFEHITAYLIRCTLIPSSKVKISKCQKILNNETFFPICYNLTYAETQTRELHTPNPRLKPTDPLLSASELIHHHFHKNRGLEIVNSHLLQCLQQTDQRSDFFVKIKEVRFLGIPKEVSQMK